MFGLRDQLLSTPEERQEHLDALDEIAEDEIHARHFDFLYENLNILDGKATALLQFNAILLAVVSIFQTSAPTELLSVSYGICLLLLLTSGLLCLYIVWIHWSTTDDLRHADRHCSRLLEVRRRRTIMYRIAWWLAVASLASFLIVKAIVTVIEAVSVLV